VINLEGVVATNWRDCPAQEIFPGIRKRVLWKGAEGAKAQILEIDAGAAFPIVDVHEPGSEEVFVVSGVFNDGVADYPAGSFIHNPAGSAHVPRARCARAVRHDARAFVPCRR
jgi:anti-sigma factor ChrR (cupin superfamily)